MSKTLEVMALGIVDSADCALADTREIMRIFMMKGGRSLDVASGANLFDAMQLLKAAANNLELVLKASDSAKQ